MEDVEAQTTRRIKAFCITHLFKISVSTGEAAYQNLGVHGQHWKRWLA